MCNVSSPQVGVGVEFHINNSDSHDKVCFTWMKCSKRKRRHRPDSGNRDDGVDFGPKGRNWRQETHHEGVSVLGCREYSMESRMLKCLATTRSACYCDSESS